MDFEGIGTEIKRLLAGYEAGVFLGGSHIWKDSGRDIDILVVLGRRPPKDVVLKLLTFARELAGETEYPIHGLPTVRGEIASIFVASKEEMMKGCFEDAWTARFVLLGLKEHPANTGKQNLLAEKAQENAWRRFLGWIAGRTAGEIEQIKTEAFEDILGSEKFTASARWTARRSREERFIKYVKSKILKKINELEKKGEIRVENGRVKILFKSTQRPFRKNISSNIRRKL